MTKRGRDHRQDPDDGDEPADTTTNHRVDRVFAPTPRPRSPAPQGTSPPPSHRDAPSEAELAARRSISALQDELAHVEQLLVHKDLELAAVAQKLDDTHRQLAGSDLLATELEKQHHALAELKRQLADQEHELAAEAVKHQRAVGQLTDAQRQLADLEEELSAEVEKRLALSATHLELVEQHRLRGDELARYKERADEVEQRLFDSMTTADELTRERDRERAARAAAEARAAEQTTVFEAAQAHWSGERAVLETEHTAELARLETEKRLALDGAEEALNATALRLREAADDERAQLERTISVLRAELAVKDVEGHKLAEDGQRLASELANLRKEALRVGAERDRAHVRAIAELEETYRAELANQTRLHGLELTGVREQADAMSQAAEGAKAAAARLETDLAARAERLAVASAEAARLREALQAAQERLVIGERDATLTRARVVAHLEAGLAMFGGDPPVNPVEPAAPDELAQDATVRVPPD